jgi:hypothetical protein
MCGLTVLNEHPGGDDLITDDAYVRSAIGAAVSSEHELLRRPAIPLMKRLGL